MQRILKIHPDDNVIVALQDFRRGTELSYNGATYQLVDAIASVISIKCFVPEF